MFTSLSRQTLRFSLLQQLRGRAPATFGATFHSMREYDQGGSFVPAGEEEGIRRARKEPSSPTKKGENQREHQEENKNEVQSIHRWKESDLDDKKKHAHEKFMKEQREHVEKMEKNYNKEHELRRQEVD